MSTLPDNELDLEKLFLPAWAQEDSSSSKYAKYEAPEDRGDRRGDRRGPRPPRRDGGMGGGAPRRDDNRGGPRGDRRGPRPEGGAPRPQGGPGDQQGGRRGPDRRGIEPRRDPPAPLPEINVALIPEEKGVESLARQIKVSGRAYPLFDIAQMILQKPERHSVVFNVKKNGEGKPVQPLFICAIDDTLWLSEDEAVAHVLRKHFGTFYQTERTATEPPKGKYTFVAQCGMSGVILGPPNYHDYQNQLRRLHGERYSRMPFEAYKARVRIVKDEEVVKKWVEDQSWKNDYICLNLPEPLRLNTMEEVEKHFRETHKENIIKPIESYTLTGAAARNLRSPELTRLVRAVWEDQKRFPLQIATSLSQQFASHGLQFFKVNKTITHVCIARPHHLDMAAAPVSEGVRRIVEFIDATPRCTRKRLVEALAPSPAQAVTPATPAAAPAAQTPGATPAEGQPAAAPVQDANQPTPEQTAVVADLHWLIHQGHVLEFANGVLETAKKPAPKPPRPEKQPRPASQHGGAEAAAATAAAASPVEQTGLSAGAVETPAGSSEQAPEGAASLAEAATQEHPAATSAPAADTGATEVVTTPSVAPDNNVVSPEEKPAQGS